MGISVRIKFKAFLKCVFIQCTLFFSGLVLVLSKERFFSEPESLKFAALPFLSVPVVDIRILPSAYKTGVLVSL